MGLVGRSPDRPAAAVAPGARGIQVEPFTADLANEALSLEACFGVFQPFSW